MKRVTDYFVAAPAKKVALASPPASQIAKPPLGAGAVLAPNSSPPKATQSSLESTWNKDEWVRSLSEEMRDLLSLEIETLHPSWLEVLRTELTKPYFLSLKRFLKSCSDQPHAPAVYPPPKDIYAWSRLTPLHKCKVLILGQDPYHNVGQAHGLAFSVRPPTPPPPSLVNIYKELKQSYPDFQVPKHGSLLKWAHQGVLMLNACLTVEAHRANSHANRGWEQFTEEVVRAALKHNKHIVVMAWGRPASLRVDKVRPGSQHLVLRSVHPSPLSASRGWFGSAHFTKANKWLQEHGEKPIDWHLISTK